MKIQSLVPLKESVDDRFNAEMLKIQKALERLKQVTKGFSDTVRPVKSQLAQLENAADELAEIEEELKKFLP